MAEQSYSNIRAYPAVNGSGAVVALAVDGTNTARTAPFLRSFKLQQVRVGMQTAYTGATVTVITVNREKEMGTATNDVAIGTFTIPITAALGDVFYVDFSAFGDTDLAPGESLNFISDGGADATTSCWFAAVGFEYDEGPVPQDGTSFSSQDKPRSGTGDIKYLDATEV